MAALSRVPLPTLLTSLPLSLALSILTLLPQDQLARASAVCRGWCRLIAEPCLWQAIDLSAESGVARACTTDEVLQALLRKAPGALVSLKLGGWWHDWQDSMASYFQKETVLAALAASQATLTTLHVDWADEGGWLFIEDVQEIVQLAPGLQSLRCCVKDDCHSVLTLLTTVPPLSLHGLALTCDEDETAEEFCATLAALSSHARLYRACTDCCASCLIFEAPPLTDPAAMTALRSVVEQLRPVNLHLGVCEFDAASVASLVALLRTQSLSEFHVSGFELGGGLLTDSLVAAELSAAIASNTNLVRLSLASTGLFDGPEDVPLAFLSRLTGLPQLKVLDLSSNQMNPETQQGLLGRALADLVACLPALDSLLLDLCFLDDAGLEPLAELLPNLTSLRVLQIGGNFYTRAFEERVLLPALAANQSLRRLGVEVDRDAELADLVEPPSEEMMAAAAAVAAREGLRAP